MPSRHLNLFFDEVKIVEQPLRGRGDATPGLVDGGGVTVPTFRMLDPNGNWFAEGHGVEPDIPVDENPTELAKGNDPQLERAIQEVQQRLAQLPAPPKRPAAEKR
jgi:tricorn protease